MPKTITCVYDEQSHYDAIYIDGELWGADQTLYLNELCEVVHGETIVLYGMKVKLPMNHEFPPMISDLHRFESRKEG